MQEGVYTLLFVLYYVGSNFKKHVYGGVSEVSCTADVCFLFYCCRQYY